MASLWSDATRLAAVTLVLGLSACGPSLAERAKAGDAQAEYEYARSDLGGEPKPPEGGSYTLVPAFTWMLRAAQQGYEPAYAEVGNDYSGGGQGTPIDPAQALRWYRLGAAAHDGRCELGLAAMIGAGQGLAADAAQGYAWMLIANWDIERPSAQEARPMRRVAEIALAAMTRDLKPAQIAEGRRLALSWRPEVAAAPTASQ
jgi:hypothetical protein